MLPGPRSLPPSFTGLIHGGQTGVNPCSAVTKSRSSLPTQQPVCTRQPRLWLKGVKGQGGGLGLAYSTFTEAVALPYAVTRGHRSRAAPP